MLDLLSRKMILSFCMHKREEGLMLFAAAKVVGRYVQQDAEAKDIIVAIMNDERIAIGLHKIGYSFDMSKLKTDDEYQRLVGILVKRLRSMTFEHFLGYVLPDSVPNSEEIINTFAQCTFRLEEYKALAVLAAKEEWMKAQEVVPESGCEGKRIAKSIACYKTDWEEFKCLVNGYPLRHVQTVSAAAIAIGDIFRKRGLSIDIGASVFCNMYANQHFLSNATDQETMIVEDDWGQKRKQNLQSIQKAIDEAGDHVAVIGKATDAFKEILLKDPQEDDSRIEVGFFLLRVLRDAKIYNSVLVLNPSPDFLEEASKQEDLFGRITVVVRYPKVAQILKRQFPQTKIISFNELDGQGNTLLFDRIWLFSREIEEPNLEPLIQRAHQLLKKDGIFCAEVPSKLVTFEDTEKQSCLHKEFRMFSIYTFDTGLFQSYPRKRVLVFATKSTGAEARAEVIRCRTHTHDGVEYLYVDKELKAIVSLETFHTTRSIYNILSIEGRRQPTESRSKPREINFSREVTFWVTLEEIKGDVDNCRVEGYVSAIPTKEQLQRNKFARGKRLDGYQRNNKVPKSKVDDWCIQTLPFHKKMQQGTIKAILESKPKKLTLKTIWYMISNFAKNWIEGEDGKKELLLFSSEIGDLTGQEEVKIFTKKINDFLDGRNEKEKLVAWRRIKEICDEGVRLGVISRNPAVREYNRLRTIDEDGDFKDVHNNFAKKWLMYCEGKKIYSYLFEAIVEAVEFLAVLIRFFTGLSPDVIAALRWKDFVKVPFSENVYHFLVYRKCNEAGESEEMTLPEKIRKFPVVGALRDSLLKRYKNIIESGMISEEELKDMPIVATDRQIKEKGEMKIKPEKVRAISKQALKILNIEDVCVTMPKKEGGKEKKNLTRYRGDLYYSNFKNMLYFWGRASEKEKCYLCGLQQNSTSGKHYHDFSNPFVQRGLHVKLSRCEAMLLEDKHSARYKSERERIKDCYTLPIEGMQVVEVDIVVKKGCKGSISVVSRYGVSFRADIETNQTNTNVKKGGTVNEYCL